MTEPLFPIHPTTSTLSGPVLIIEPYRHEGAWLFDDARVDYIASRSSLALLK